MFSSNSLPPADPYTPLPKSRMANTRPRATSVSFPPKPSTQQQVNSKRHTYHALQVPEVKGRDRVVSLPSAVAHQAVSTSRAPTPLPGNPRRLNNSDPRALLRALDSLLDPQSQRIPEHLDVDHLMAVHERDAMEREQRDAIKVHARMNRAAGQGGVCTGQTVFGSSLREATTYASTATVLGGYEHDVPIVVFRCVQELCRHGHHTPIPQRPPDRNRLLALISAFDSEPHFGLKTSFDCPSELPEAYALLTTYLLALPLPILDSDLFEALWAWCVLPSLRRTDFLEDDNNHNINRSRSSRQAPPDAACIRIAHLLLRLLPLSNLSLLVYMMGFFQRLPHMIREDVGRAVVAGRRASADPTDVRVINVAEGRSARAETMLRWLLERWDAIFRELFMYGEVEQQKEYTSGARRVDPELTPRVGQEGGVGGQPGKLLLCSEGSHNYGLVVLQLSWCAGPQTVYSTSRPVPSPMPPAFLPLLPSARGYKTSPWRSRKSKTRGSTRSASLAIQSVMGLPPRLRRRPATPTTRGTTPRRSRRCHYLRRTRPPSRITRKEETCLTRKRCTRYTSSSARSSGATSLWGRPSQRRSRRASRSRSLRRSCGRRITPNRASASRSSRPCWSSISTGGWWRTGRRLCRWIRRR